MKCTQLQQEPILDCQSDFLGDLYGPRKVKCWWSFQPWTWRQKLWKWCWQSGINIRNERGPRAINRHLNASKSNWISWKILKSLVLGMAKSATKKYKIETDEGRTYSKLDKLKNGPINRLKYSLYFLRVNVVYFIFTWEMFPDNPW